MKDEKDLGPELPPEDEQTEQLIKAMLYAFLAFVCTSIILIILTFMPHGTGNI